MEHGTKTTRRKQYQMWDSYQTTPTICLNDHGLSVLINRQRSIDW